jgi:transketolase
MKDISIEELKDQAQDLRRKALTMIYEAQSGHPGGAFSAAEVVTYLYFKEMNIDPKNPKWADRDRFILSKGHACPIQYAALGTLGYFPEEEMHKLRKEGSMLQGHPNMKKCPGIDISTGSLGQGLSVGVGMALGGKRDKKDYRVFVVLGDGELDEGELWEGFMAANAWGLDNLVVILDDNGLQLDGPADEIIPHLDVVAKMKAFGFETYDIDGNDMEQVADAFEKINASTSGKPKFIEAHTIKGKGVSYMENQLGWHGKAPNDEEYEIAMKELGGR